MNAPADDPLAIARLLAGVHRMRIAEVTEPRDRRDPAQGTVPAWVVYRNNQRMGRRRDPRALLRLVKDLAGIPK